MDLFDSFPYPSYNPYCPLYNSFDEYVAPSRPVIKKKRKKKVVKPAIPFTDPTAVTMAATLETAYDDLTGYGALADRLDEQTQAPDFAYALRWLHSRNMYPRRTNEKFKRKFEWRAYRGKGTSDPAIAHCVMTVSILKNQVLKGHVYSKKSVSTAFYTWWEAVAFVAKVLAKYRSQVEIRS